MNFIKSFWSSAPTTSNGEVYVTQEPNNAVSYNNAVTFTTAHTSSNSIIITTLPQNSQQVKYSHSQQVLEVPAMASPTDSQKSFHSANSTTFNQIDSGNKGKVNMGYAGSRTELDNSRQMQPNQNNNQ
jgi:hypothetical protein